VRFASYPPTLKGYAFKNLLNRGNRGNSSPLG
jgi:hypothetical protein